jgi:hypothetical protein
VVAAALGAGPGTRAVSRCEGPERAAVEVSLVGPAERRVAVREVLAELLAERVLAQWHEHEGTDVAAAIRGGEPDDLALAHVYVDLREAPLLIYIGDQGHVRVLIRRVALPANFDEAAREEVGVIVASAVDALCAGGTIGIVRAAAIDAPAPAPVVVPVVAPVVVAPVVVAASPRPAVRRWSGGVLARYRLMGWAPLRLQHTLELGGVLRRRVGRVDPQLAVWAGAITPTAVTRAPDAGKIAGASLRLEVGAVTLLASRWSQLVAVGGGVDLLRGAGRWLAVPMLQASVGVRATLGRGLLVELQGHAAVDLVDTRILDAADGRVLLDPWRVRPGISLTFGGSSPR